MNKYTRYYNLYGSADGLQQFNTARNDRPYFGPGEYPFFIYCIYSDLENIFYKTNKWSYCEGINFQTDVKEYENTHD